MDLEKILFDILGQALGQLGPYAIQRLKYLVEAHSQSKARDAFIRAEAFRMLPTLYDYLEFHLRERPLIVAGVPVQMMLRNLHGYSLKIPVFLAWTGRNIVLTPFEDDEVYEWPDWKNSEYVRVRQQLKPILDDDPVYEAYKIWIEPNNLRIEGALGTYGSALSTQDALAWELLQNAASLLGGINDRAMFARLMNRLSMRLEAEAQSDNYILNGVGRCNALAISTTIVYKDFSGDYKIMCGKRSANVAAYPHLFHVIPAAMFQPQLGGVNEEWDVKHNVLREYGEELFSLKLEKNAWPPNYFFEAWPPVSELRKAINEGKCEFFVTGLVVDLLNLRPEICTLLLVKDEHWWQGQLREVRTGWEYVSRQEILSRDKRARTDFSLRNVEYDFLNYFSQLAGDRGAIAGLWVPPGLAAFWLAVDVARDELQIV